MRLGKTVLKSIKNTLNNLGYPNYQWIVPEGTNTPYITYYITSTNTSYCFNSTKGVIEEIKVLFTVFDNDSNSSDALDCLNAIENSFENYSVVDGNYLIGCTHKTNEYGPLLNPLPTGNKYKQWHIELTFTCSRNVGA